METEREWKAKPEHWALLIECLESNRSLLNNKFNSNDGDHFKLKQEWKEVATRLNSLGYGTKSVEKWRLALSRWKSKVKSKAATLSREKRKTGGGEARTPALTPIEERLMALMGWKYVVGDGNKEIGLATTSQEKQCSQSPATGSQPQITTSQITTSFQSQATSTFRSEATTSQCQASTSQENDVENSLPQLVLFPTPTGTKKRNGPESIRNVPDTKRKKTLSSEKSRKFVSMSKVHEENKELLTTINKSLVLLNNTMLTISDTLKRYVDHVIDD